MVADDGRIELQAHDLRMAGAAAGNLLVAGICLLPTRIAGLDTCNTTHLPVHRIDAPEAPPAQYRHIQFRTHFVIPPVIGQQDNVARYATVIQTAGACLAAAWNILQIDDQTGRRYSDFEISHLQ